jgi:hypothetical protein
VQKGYTKLQLDLYKSLTTQICWYIVYKPHNDALFSFKTIRLANVLSFNIGFGKEISFYLDIICKNATIVHNAKLIMKLYSIK